MPEFLANIPGGIAGRDGTQLQRQRLRWESSIRSSPYRLAQDIWNGSKRRYSTHR